MLPWGRKFDVLEIGLEQAVELINIKKNKPTNKVREIGVLKRRRQKQIYIKENLENIILKLVL